MSDSRVEAFRELAGRLHPSEAPDHEANALLLLASHDLADLVEAVARDRGSHNYECELLSCRHGACDCGVPDALEAVLSHLPSSPKED